MNRQRHPWDPVILTSLPHVLCAIAAPYPYSLILAASVSISLMWHLEHEPMNNTFFWMDYSSSLIVGFYDVATLGIPGLTLNFITIGTNMLVHRLATTGLYPYERGLSFWNLFVCVLTVYKIDLLIRARKGETWPPRLTDSTTPPTL
jgi:hypothetical protein